LSPKEEMQAMDAQRAANLEADGGSHRPEWLGVLFWLNHGTPWQTKVSDED
jgi:hypothetical protein